MSFEMRLEEFMFDLILLGTLFQTMRIDISSIGHSGKSRIDTAVKIYYTPPKVDHLLVVTGNNKLFKFDARTGRILSEVSLLLYFKSSLVIRHLL